MGSAGESSKIYNNMKKENFETIALGNTIENFCVKLTTDYWKDILPKDIIGADTKILLICNIYSPINQFDIDGSKEVDDMPNIMICVQSDKDSNMFDIFRYNGALKIDRTKIGDMKLDSILNMKEFLNDLRAFLNTHRNNNYNQ
jgi:hypothetical protein